MFIFDFVAETILDQILDWIYGKIIGFLNDFFVMMNNMGVELFELPWVNAVTTFFSYLGWALFGVGLVVGAFECAIEYQGGRGSIKDTAMNYIKGFMAVSLFTVVPVNLYSLCVSLQGTFGSAITGITNAESIGLTAQQVLMSASFPGIGNPILMTFCAVMMGYAVIKVFFANLKRGGILLIQIAVGSLYMFSVPRGYIDGFIQWCKQVIGICITAFLQSTILTAGLMVFKDHPLLGLGLMLSSTEVPRIAGQFGLDGGMVDRQHAVLNYAAGQWYIEDLGSRNGVRIQDAKDGKLYQVSKEHPCRINAGDIIFIGNTRLRAK